MVNFVRKYKVNFVMGCGLVRWHKVNLNQTAPEDALWKGCG